MRKILLLHFSILSVVVLHAQIDINNVVMETSPVLCRPGVIHKSPGKGASFTYSFNSDYRIRPPDVENSSKVHRDERFDAKIKIPLVNKQRFKLLLGFQYTLERYHFEKIIPDNYPLFKRLNETDLKNTGIAAYIVCPVNHQYYTSFHLSTNWQGDYRSFVTLDNRFAVYRLAGVFGVKKRDNLEYGFGILVNKGFKNSSAVPFGFYNHTFNDHWGLETTLPTSIKVRYNFNEKRMVLVGTEFSSQTYAMNVYEPSSNPFTINGVEKAPYHYQRTSLDAVVMIYQQLTNWIWVQVKCGYGFNLQSQAKDLPESRTYDLKPSGSTIGMVSFFIAPPKKLLE